MKYIYTDVSKPAARSDDQTNHPHDWQTIVPNLFADHTRRITFAPEIILTRFSASRKIFSTVQYTMAHRVCQISVIRSWLRGYRFPGRRRVSTDRVCCFWSRESLLDRDDESHLRELCAAMAQITRRPIPNERATYATFQASANSGRYRYRGQQTTLLSSR